MPITGDPCGRSFFLDAPNTFRMVRSHRLPNVKRTRRIGFWSPSAIRTFRFMPSGWEIGSKHDRGRGESVGVGKSRKSTKGSTAISTGGLGFSGHRIHLLPMATRWTHGYRQQFGHKYRTDAAISTRLCTKLESDRERETQSTERHEISDNQTLRRTATDWFAQSRCDTGLPS